MSALEDRKKIGLVFNIQKYSVHDGPGIRTIVFLKGCPLSCDWCSNPESQRHEPELAFNPGRCLTFSKCTRCLQACLRGAIIREADDSLRVDRALCDGCPKNCAQACPSQGLIVYGEERSVDEVLRVVEQDAAFYTRSSGGMTLSGGEPLLQADFALALLREARRRRIRTAVETCGMVPWKTMAAAAEHLNYVLYDIKHMDGAVHEAQTGRSNEVILENFRRLAELHPGKPILARTPVIPGFNDSEEAIAAIAEFIRPYPNVRYEMLPYHRLGTQKYHFLDRVPPMDDVTLDKSVMPRLIEKAVQILGERVDFPK
jgi:pyruvate formate lyase activating enzyme